MDFTPTKTPGYQMERSLVFHVKDNDITIDITTFLHHFENFV